MLPGMREQLSERDQDCSFQDNVWNTSNTFLRSAGTTGALTTRAGQRTLLDQFGLKLPVSGLVVIGLEPFAALHARFGGARAFPLQGAAEQRSWPRHRRDCGPRAARKLSACGLELSCPPERSCLVEVVVGIAAGAASMGLL